VRDGNGVERHIHEAAGEEREIHVQAAGTRIDPARIRRRDIVSYASSETPTHLYASAKRGSSIRSRAPRGDSSDKSTTA
jgi:hypothetical protein